MLKPVGKETRKDRKRSFTWSWSISSLKCLGTDRKIYRRKAGKLLEPRLESSLMRKLKSCTDWQATKNNESLLWKVRNHWIIPAKDTQPESSHEESSGHSSSTQLAAGRGQEDSELRPKDELTIPELQQSMLLNSGFCIWCVLLEQLAFVMNGDADYTEGVVVSVDVDSDGCLCEVMWACCLRHTLEHPKVRKHAACTVLRDHTAEKRSQL